MMVSNRTNREADCPLHILAMRHILQYLFTAKHINKVHYGLYSSLLKERLPCKDLKRFMQREHVMRHILGIYECSLDFEEKHKLTNNISLG